MAKKEADLKEDIKAVKDRGEAVAMMEPLLIGAGSRQRAGLTDLALELAQKSAGFRRSLPPSLLVSLADLVRSMNCYYSNLIEGVTFHAMAPGIFRLMAPAAGVGSGLKRDSRLRVFSSLGKRRGTRFG